MSSRRELWMLAAVGVCVACGDIDNRLALDCPDGTSVVTERHGAELERWCARPDGIRQGGFVRSRGEHPTLTGQYEDGQKHGVWRQWNGPTLVGRYIMDHGTGVEPIWNNGLRKIEESSFVEGRREGAYTEWHGNRLYKVIGSFKDGKKSGRWFEFDPSGKLISETRYEAGEQVD